MHVRSEAGPRLHDYDYARTVGDDAEGVRPGREGMRKGRMNHLLAASWAICETVCPVRQAAMS
ncbi:hypothetical protein BH20GEM2_BH20GEM2_18070 [soil metagenome]